MRGQQGAGRGCGSPCGLSAFARAFTAVSRLLPTIRVPQPSLPVSLHSLARSVSQSAQQPLTRDGPRLQRRLQPAPSDRSARQGPSLIPQSALHPLTSLHPAACTLRPHLAVSAPLRPAAPRPPPPAVLPATPTRLGSPPPGCHAGLPHPATASAAVQPWPRAAGAGSSTRRAPHPHPPASARAAPRGR